MSHNALPLVDWTIYTLTRIQLGPSFIRILGYFQEDGLASIDAMESAMRAGDAAALVNPAHKLKSEARQFGGERLAQLAEDIEYFARACVENHESPADYVDRVVALRPIWLQTLDEIEAEASPLQRRAGFGRRTA